MAEMAERVFHAHLPFYTLLKREVLRFINVSAQTLVTPIVTASLYLLVFGVSLGQRVSVLDDFSYAQFVIPGLVLMGVAQNSFANTSSSLFMARYLGFIVDFLVTPLSPRQFILAYTLAAMLRGLLVGTVVLIVSSFFATIPWPFALQGVLLIVLTSFLFAQFGIIAAIHSNSFDGLAMFTNFLILPLIYLGGLFYPVSLLPDFWGKLSMLNPLFYMIDGFRYCALGVSDSSYLTSFLVTLVLSGAVFSWAAVLIGKGHKLRT